MKRKVAALLALCLLGPACGIQDDVQRATGILQSAVDQIANAPGNVKAILADAITQLDQFSETVIMNADTAVKDVLAETAGLANTVAQCALDEIGIHVSDALVYVNLHILQGKPAPPPTPWVCLTNPTTIDLVQSAQAGPYALASPPNYQVFGTNFREQTLPQIDYLRSTGQVVLRNVVAAGLHSAYEIDINLQTIDFSRPQTGDYLTLVWPGQTTGTNRIVITLKPYQAPPHQHQVTRFEVRVHAPGGNISSQCVKIQDDPLSSYTVTSPWTIDTTLGDPGHPGIHEDVVNDNQQSINSLDSSHDYNYRAVNNVQVQVQGTICSQGGWGAGAIFDRSYVVYQIQ